MPSRNPAATLAVEPVANALKHLWAKGRPKREATSRDWIEANQFNRWQAIRLIPHPIEKPLLAVKTQRIPALAQAKPILMQPWKLLGLAR
jgi:hypothetical protein